MMQLGAKAGAIASKAVPTAVVARMTGRCFWEALRWDGKTYREVDGIDWLDLPKAGLVDLRLIAPDGTGRGFGNTADATGRLFQLKGATFSAGLGGGGGGRQLDFHLIGMIKDTSGQCVCWVYDHRLKAWLPPLDDNFFAMEFSQLGPLNPVLLG